MLEPVARRPAIPLAVAFLLGAVLAGSAHATIGPLAIPGLLAALVASIRIRAPRVRRGVVLALLVCLGAATMLDAADRARRRTASWLGTDGAPVELTFSGRVVAAPLAEPDGGRLLRVRGLPETIPAAREPATVRLRVHASPPEPTRSLDRLRTGDRVRIWCRIRIPRPSGNPGATDPHRALLAAGIDAVGTVKNARLVEKTDTGPWTLGRFLDAARVGASDRLDRAFLGRPRSGAVLRAVVLGDRSRVDAGDVRALRDGGLVHLLAISGLHVSLAVLVVVSLLRRVFSGGPWLVTGLAVLLLLGLVSLVGPRPSVLRAAISACFLILGRSIGRAGDARNTLAVAAMVVLSWNPFLLRAPGFQLSFLATGGILWLSGPIAQSLPLPKLPARAIAISAGAYLATAPALAFHFGKLTPAALVSNLLGATILAFVFLSGWGALLLADVAFATPVLAGIADRSVDLLFAVSTACSAIPGGHVGTPPPGSVLVTVYSSLVVASTRPLRLLPARIVRLAAALALVPLHLGAPPAVPPAFEVAVIDVGQAQAVAVRAAPGRCVLVDAAGTRGTRFDQGERVVIPFLRRWGCRRLDALVVSHAHDDHAGGAPAVLREMEVGEVWLGAGSRADPGTAEIVGIARRRGTAIVHARRGHRATRAGVPIEVLHPTPRDVDLGVNDRSVVIRIGEAAAKILIPGDVERTGEARLLAREADLSARALIAPHHGSSGSGSQPFLDAVSPEIVVISAGKGNRFGHPGRAALERLDEVGARVYRTDTRGLVELRAHEGGFGVSPR